MSAADSGPVYMNGGGPDYLDSVARSEKFYEKLLQLSKDVFAGNHPRLKASAAKTAPKETVSDRNADSAFPPSVDVRTGAENGLPFLPGLNNYTAPSSLSHASQQPSSSSVPAPPQHRQPAAASGSSQINPVLLEKSDNLIKAELQIKRRREEEAIRQEAEAARANGNPDGASNALLNVNEILEKAQAIVHPVSGIRGASPHDASSDSFDENSYYSSKANTWSTEHSDPQEDQNDPDAMVLSDGDDDLYEEYEPPAQVQVPNAQASTAIAQQSGAIQDLHIQVDHDSEEQWEPQWDEDEDDYEPPAPHAFEDTIQNNTFASYGNNASAHHIQHHLPPAAENRLQGRQGRHGGGPTIVENRIRSPISIVLNQIPTPAAPQPSRISPLAVGNNLASSIRTQVNGQRRPPSGPAAHQIVHRADQNNSVMERNSGNDSRHGSPDGPPRTLRQRRKQERAAAAAESVKKRKRGGTPEDRETRRKKGKRKVVTPVQRSPEPYIKPEPVSPPPDFSRLDAAPSRRPSRMYREEPEEVALASPRITRPRSAYYGEYEPSPRGYRYSGDDYDRIAMPPPVAYRRVERDTQDLRRVASLHAARRPISPAREYITHAPVDPRAMEPTYEIVERPPREPLYRESSMRPEGTRYIRIARSPSPHRAIDPYVRVQSPALMPAPPMRHFVVDEYGNRYYAEQPIVDHRASVVPPPRRVDVEPYERAATRDPTTRPARVAEAYEEGLYSGMPPPPRVRAYTHAPEADTNRSHRERAYSVRPQEAPRREIGPRIGYSEHVTDLERRPPPPRYDDGPGVHEYVPRAYSVRPEPPRGEMVTEYPARSGSVHPAGYTRREMPPPPVTQAREQVLVDEGYRYAPAPAPAPIPAAHHRRYADEVDPTDQVARAPYSDGRRIVSYRY